MILRSRSHAHVLMLDHQKVGAFVRCACGYSQYATKIGIAGAYIMAHRMTKFALVRKRVVPHVTTP